MRTPVVAVHMGLFIQLVLDNLLESHPNRDHQITHSASVQRQPLSAVPAGYEILADDMEAFALVFSSSDR